MENFRVILTCGYTMTYTNAPDGTKARWENWKTKGFRVHHPLAAKPGSMGVKTEGETISVVEDI